MLRAGGVSVGVGALARLAVASQAMGSVFPAGYLVSGVVVLRVLCRDAAVLARRHDLPRRRLPRRRRPPPWRALLLAYAAGQLATLLPITPGGLGITEGSMAVALAANGGGTATAVAAVLLYRLIAYWAILPAGGLCYLSLRRGHSLVIPASAVGAHAMPAAQSARLAGHAGAQED
jgi:uncharacterized membrane protein YbhN (UPF0104 family)